MKASYADKKIEGHLEKAIKIIDKVEDDADKEITKLLDAVDKEIVEEDEKPIEFILFKANEEMDEISDILDQKIAIEKQTLSLKSKE